MFLKSISYDFIFKICSVALSFIQVPLLLNYLGKESYGFWIVLFSILQWVTIFDFGIANGLRNIIPKLLHEKKESEINSYLVCSCMLLIFISAVGISVSFTFNNLIEPSFFGLNHTPVWFDTIVSLFLVVFFVYLFLSIVKPIAFVVHKPYLVSFSTFIPALGIVIYLALYNNIGKEGELLFDLLLVHSFSYLIASCVIVLIILYKHVEMFEGKMNFSFPILKSILSSSSNLFLLQIVALLTYSVDSILVAINFNSEVVTEFHVVNRIYYMYIFLVGVFISPLWNTSVDLIIKNDRNKLYYILVRYWKLYLLSVPLMLTSPFVIDYIISLWVGNDVVTKVNYFYFVFFYLVTGLGMINSVVLNAANIVKIQWVIGLTVALSKIFLFSYFLNFFDKPDVSLLLLLGALLNLMPTLFMFYILLRSFGIVDNRYRWLPSIFNKL